MHTVSDPQDKPRFRRSPYKIVGGAARTLIEQACRANPPLKPSEHKVIHAVNYYLMSRSKLEDFVSLQQLADVADLHRKTVGKILNRFNERDDIGLIFNPGDGRSNWSSIHLPKGELHAVPLLHPERGAKSTLPDAIKGNQDAIKGSRVRGDRDHTEEPRTEKDVNQSEETPDTEISTHSQNQNRAAKGEATQPNTLDAYVDTLVEIIPWPADERQRRAELSAMFDYFRSILDPRVFEEVIARTIEADTAKNPSYVAEALNEAAGKVGTYTDYRVKAPSKPKPQPRHPAENGVVVKHEFHLTKEERMSRLQGLKEAVNA